MGAEGAAAVPIPNKEESVPESSSNAEAVKPILGTSMSSSYASSIDSESSTTNSPNPRSSSSQSKNKNKKIVVTVVATGATLQIWMTCWPKIWIRHIPPTRVQLHPISSIKTFSIKIWIPRIQKEKFKWRHFSLLGSILSFLYLYRWCQISELLQIDLNISQH